MDLLIRRFAASIRPHRAVPRPGPSDTGRAAAGRAGSFNSGKNVRDEFFPLFLQLRVSWGGGDMGEVVLRV